MKHRLIADITLEALANVCKIPSAVKVLYGEYVSETETFRFYLEGDSLPEVSEGGSILQVHIPVTSRWVVEANADQVIP